MKILITGANGLLGQHLLSILQHSDHDVVATGKGDFRIPIKLSNRLQYFSLDITNENDWHLLATKIDRLDAVIHCAALTQVDFCEQHQQETDQVNVLGTELAARFSQSFAAHFIFISTDFVFDGTTGMYTETDPVNAVNYYGTSKIKGERLASNYPGNWSIIRTCLVFGNVLVGTRSNIISWVKESLEQNKPIKVVSDQVRTPTYVKDLALGILACVTQKAGGVFHVSGEEILTPYDMAMKTVDYFNLDGSLITKVNANTFTQPGQRPLKTGFNISKAKNELGYSPISFQDAIHDMMNQ